MCRCRTLLASTLLSHIWHRKFIEIIKGIYVTQYWDVLDKLARLIAPLLKQREKRQHCPGCSQICIFNVCPRDLHLYFDVKICHFPYLEVPKLSFRLFSSWAEMWTWESLPNQSVRNRKRKFPDMRNSIFEHVLCHVKALASIFCTYLYLIYWYIWYIRNVHLQQCLKVEEDQGGECWVLHNLMQFQSKSVLKVQWLGTTTTVHLLGASQFIKGGLGVRGAPKTLCGWCKEATSKYCFGEYSAKAIGGNLFDINGFTEENKCKHLLLLGGCQCWHR